MNWTDIIVALIAMIGTGLGTVYGIRKSNSLVEHRLTELEKKVDKHNQLQDRLLLVEQQTKTFSAEIETLKVATARQSEQLDNLYELVGKVQDKLELIEKSIISRVGGRNG